MTAKKTDKNAAAKKPAAAFRLLKNMHIGRHYFEAGTVIVPSDLPYPEHLHDQGCRKQPKLFLEVGEAEAAAAPAAPVAGENPKPLDKAVLYARIKEAAEGLDLADNGLWTSAGRPSPEAISRLVGKKVSAAQIKAAAPDVARGG